jgi:hypothetical protein
MAHSLRTDADGLEIDAAVALDQLFAVVIDDCAGGNRLVGASEIANGEEKIGDHGGDGSLVSGCVDPGGLIYLVGHSDGYVAHENAPFAFCLLSVMLLSGWQLGLLTYLVCAV